VPALREIEKQIQNSSHLCHKERRPFTIYSCHDVTILGLLYAMRADFLVEPDTNTSKDWGQWRWWPGYASTLAFELVQLDEEKNGLGSHVLRVLLDRSPLDTTNSAKNITDKNDQGGGIIQLSDFSCLIQRLEKAGKVEAVEGSDANTDSQEKVNNSEFRTG